MENVDILARPTGAFAFAAALVRPQIQLQLRRPPPPSPIGLHSPDYCIINWTSTQFDGGRRAHRVRVPRALALRRGQVTRRGPPALRSRLRPHRAVVTCPPRLRSPSQKPRAF